MVSFYSLVVYVLSYIGLFAVSFYAINLLFYYKKEKDEKLSSDKSVTIIIPAYNEEAGIVRTIKSALEIDYPRSKKEIIVVDDGSKDKTYELALRYKSKKNNVRVFTKKNGGKASALNFGIEKARGEIIITMDADSFVKKDSLKRMIPFFEDKRVMCVSPSMAVYKPRGLWNRIVQIEYFVGVFLRKSFATINAIHVTPGAFSSYKKEFFLKHEGFQVGNITEDLELALRIQSHGYRIENSPKSVAYTFSPEKFKDLLYQRRRWYIGLARNLWNYKRLFGFKRGPLGYLVLPIAVVSIFASVFLTIYMTSKGVFHLWNELLDLGSVNFKFNNYFEFNGFLFERLFFSLFSKPIFLISVLFICLLVFYVYFAKRQMLYEEEIRINLVFFVLFYALLFSFWWVVSFIYLIFNKKVAWRAPDGV